MLLTYYKAFVHQADALLLVVQVATVRTHLRKQLQQLQLGIKACDWFGSLVFFLAIGGLLLLLW